MFSEKLTQSGLFQSLVEENCFQSLELDDYEINISHPSISFQKLWERYLQSKSGNLHDEFIFKCIVLSVLHATLNTKINLDANFFPYPNIDYEISFYSRVFGPVTIETQYLINQNSNSNELRSTLLKQVHRRSKSFLITLDEREANVVNEKIKAGLILGLDEVIIANGPSFDNLVKNLKSYDLYEPEPVDVLTSIRFISS